MTRKTTEFDRLLGHRIRKARLLRGLTQEELGRIAGVSSQQIQKNERGENRISAERLNRISKQLNMPAGFFFDERPEGDKDDTFYPSGKTLQLAAEIYGLPDARIAKSVGRLVAAINTAWETKNA
ncbi:transcriptional regulator with XRE-family HTH domain [Rhodobium orientis]|nr:helix-turn-helix transcriptional regulator [Rhodobium orientis]MBB4305113.1 transcriptional regulator with XRE-family HTH domain [Rhodobium orientis]